MSSKPWSKKKPVRSSLSLALAVSGITVSPALTQLDLAHDSPAFTLRYTNHTSSPVQLEFRARDFTSLEEGWRVKFLEPSDPATYNYSLSSWLDFSPHTLLLPVGESGILEVSVRAQSLAAGGHYGTVIADVSAAPSDQTGTVQIRSELASLVFVRAATGHEKDSARIAEFSSPDSSLLTLPDSYTLRFDNTGNTFLTPHGLLVIRDMLGREVSRGLLNLDSLPTLPETVRRYDIPVNVHSVSWPVPGPYQASLTVSYGSGRQVSSHLQFFSFGSRPNLYLTVAILLLLILASRLILQKVKRRQHFRP